LTHHFETLMILVWHVGTTGLLLVAARFLGPQFLRKAMRRSAPRSASTLEAYK
jgi:hypothetical protein